MPAVADMMRYGIVSALFLNWNKIAAYGCTLLCESLHKTDTLKTLDLSFNPLSKKGKNKDKYPECLSTMFQMNESILHLDLSHTGITWEDGQIIDKGFNENHSILGVHLTGNEITLTADGFITKQKKHDAGNSHIMTRITESLFMGGGDSGFRA